MDRWKQTVSRLNSYTRWVFCLVVFLWSTSSAFLGPASVSGNSRNTFSLYTLDKASSDGEVDIARRLKERAAKLREEISDFEKNKADELKTQKNLDRKHQERKERIKQQYSVNIPILKQDGKVVEENVFFSPRVFGEEGLKENKVEADDNQFASIILRVDLPLPLGIVIGEEFDKTSGSALVTVDEIDSEVNEMAVNLLQAGDIIRGCSATQTQMSTPTWQLVAGGIGQPKTVRFMYSCDDRPFEEVMEAIKSNRMDPQGRPCVLVIERKI
mmetsp:Transcript_11821/g.15449  ORF Transcript_11821/g.15449 Transcript_11821/m.15449 type:complete len:271 (-) Transcript_11821:896-1708(-)|eukprot:CAMPEP_0117754580 /NCGR_PEP_ID=MMETSP0947-20121206/12909_1 /TAXON_ID=44440 /ORGANISM="Chattonella subsalsa, Strain CCMP2191" /LENGTH=270 /DNA_ID=CAMNT_0005573687 /DNA_START=37 /DNA_END=849 /DNA_ORIENTATION=+